MPKPNVETRMSLGEHLAELRKRLIRAFLGVVVGVVIAFFLGDLMFKVLFWPLWLGTGGHPPKLYFSSLPESFLIYFKICLVAGVIISSPFAIYQVWQFVAAGLHDYERRTVRKFVVPSVLLFLVGVAFYFVIVAPAVVYWLLDFGKTGFPSPAQWNLPWVKYMVPLATASQPATAAALPPEGYVSPLLTLESYINFTTLMALVFGIAFETPLVVFFLTRIGVISYDRLKRSRKYVFFVALLIAIFITPSQDLFSNITMTVVIYLLYEVGMLISRPKKGERELSK